MGWKWSDEKHAHVMGQDDFKGYKKGVLNDKALIEFFIPILQQADLVTGHNSDQFDIKVFNTRLLYHGFPKVPIHKSFDTKKISKGNFHLPSNKLDDIAHFLGIKGKLSHTGKDMWLGCESGKDRDWRLMKRYCKQDVYVEDEVAKKLVPFMRPSNDFLNGADCANPLCASSNTKKAKLRKVKNGFRRQYQCNDCGLYWSDPTLIKE